MVQKTPKRYYLTSEIMLKRNIYKELNNSAEKLLQRSFFKRKMSMQEILLFLEQKARAETNIWQAVYTEYPELKGKNLAMGSHEIKIIPEPKSP